MSHSYKRRRSPSQGAADLSPTAIPLQLEPYSHSRFHKSLQSSPPCSQDRLPYDPNRRAKRQKVTTRNRVVSPRNCDPPSRQRRSANRSHRTQSTRPSANNKLRPTPIPTSAQSATRKSLGRGGRAQSTTSPSQFIPRIVSNASSNDDLGSSAASAYDAEDEDEGDEDAVELGMAILNDTDRTPIRLIPRMGMDHNSSEPSLSPSIDPEGEEVDMSLFPSPIRATSGSQAIDVKGKGVDPLEYGTMSLKRRHSESPPLERVVKAMKRPLEPNASIVSLTNRLDGLSADSMMDIAPIADIRTQSALIDGIANVQDSPKTDMKSSQSPTPSTVSIQIDSERPRSPYRLDGDIDMLSAASEHSDTPALCSEDRQVQERRIQKIHERRKKTLRRRFDKMSLNASEAPGNTTVRPFPISDKFAYTFLSGLSPVVSSSLSTQRSTPTLNDYTQTAGSNLQVDEYNDEDEHTVNVSLEWSMNTPSMAVPLSKPPRPPHMQLINRRDATVNEIARVFRVSQSTARTSLVAFPTNRVDILRRREIASDLALPHLAIHRTIYHRGNGAILTGQEVICITKLLLKQQRERRDKLCLYNQKVRVTPWRLDPAFIAVIAANQTRGPVANGSVEETEVEQLLPGADWTSVDQDRSLATTSTVSPVVTQPIPHRIGSATTRETASARRRREGTHGPSNDQRARVIQQLRLETVRRNQVARAEVRRTLEERRSEELRVVEPSPPEAPGPAEIEEVVVDEAEVIEFVPQEANAQPIGIERHEEQAVVQELQRSPPPAYEPPSQPLPIAAPVPRRYLNLRQSTHCVSRERTERPPLYRPNRYTRRSPSPPPPYNASTDCDVLVPARFDEDLLSSPRRGSPRLVRRHQRQNRIERRTLVGAFPNYEGADSGNSDVDVESVIASPQAGSSRLLDEVTVVNETVQPPYTSATAINNEPGSSAIGGAYRYMQNRVTEIGTALALRRQQLANGAMNARGRETEISSFDIALEVEEGEDVEMAIWMAENAVAARRAQGEGNNRREHGGESSLSAVSRWIGQVWRWNS